MASGWAIRKGKTPGSPLADCAGGARPSTRQPTGRQQRHVRFKWDATGHKMKQIIEKPGQMLLVQGAIIYAVAFLGLAVGALVYKSTAANTALAFLWLTPIFLLLVSVLLSWSAFFIGSITGTPLVSFTYGFSSMKRNWRGVIGGVLLAGVLSAAIAYLKTN